LSFGFKTKPILTKSWILSENWSDWMLDYCFLHNFQYVCAFVLTESSLCWVPCLWVSFWFFGVLRCSLFFLCLICFIQVFWVFVFLVSLICFLALVLFFVCFRVKSGFLVRFMVKPMISNQPNRVNSVGYKKYESKGLYLIWFVIFFC